MERFMFVMIVLKPILVEKILNGNSKLKKVKIVGCSERVGEFINYVNSIKEE
jgi:hypothetical protein